MSNLILTCELAYKHYLETVHYNKDEYDEKRDKKVNRASMGGRCHKLQKYHLSDVEAKKIDHNTMMVFRIGNVYHAELQEGFRWLIDVKNKDNDMIKLEMEKKVTVIVHGVKVEGHFDIRLFDHANKVVQVTDIKTMNPRAMSFFKKDPYSKTGNMIQLGTYAMATQEEFPDYKVVVLITAWDKDKGEFFEKELDTDRIVSMADKYYKDLSVSMKMELDEIIPIQHPFSPMEQWECNYCDYNHICSSPKIKRV